MTKKFVLGSVVILSLMMLFSACNTQAEFEVRNGAEPVVHRESAAERGNGAQGFDKDEEHPSNSGEGIYHPTGGELDEVEIADLIFMREEEKVARDVYAYLYSQWNLPVFDSIAQSEQNHMDAILELLTAYAIDDPVVDNTPGVFVDDTLQKLYDDLIARGSQSLEEALRVGALIEEVDILDLEEALQNTDEVDIQRVYSNLLFGSENHLRSFTSQLSRQLGIVYSPTNLTQERYEEIVNDQPGQRGRAAK